jgi:hypothetical protein
MFAPVHVRPCFLLPAKPQVNATLFGVRAGGTQATAKQPFGATDAARDNPASDTFDIKNLVAT